MAVIDEVRRVNAVFNKALANGDAAGVSSLYTDDARLLADGAPRIDGRSAIDEFFKQAVESGFKSLELHTQEVIETGDLVIEVGQWTSSSGGGDQGKYVVVWKRESDGLKIDIDIFNSDTRAPGELVGLLAADTSQGASAWIEQGSSSCLPLES
jgi:uncharacterized protein (TIGR02246 family)